VNARRAANQRLGGEYDARVLEPSPPAVTEGPWLACDPVNDGEPDATGRPVVKPVTGADTTWDDLCHDDRELADWCAARWLGAWRPLPPAPEPGRLAATRASLHALAEHVLSPARHAANGKIGLRFTRGGFGTPFFRDDAGDDKQVRVEGDELVVDLGEATHRAPITTVGTAADFARCAAGAPVGAGYDEAGVRGVYEPTTPFAPDAPLVIDPDSARFLGDWFGFAAGVLEQLRAEADDADQPARVQLWPEHFDLSVDLGDDAAGARGTFGASPGDEAHDNPYLYVTHWADADPDRFWNDGAFDGASLSLPELVPARDQRAAALDFLRSGRRVLRSS